MPQVILRVFAFALLLPSIAIAQVGDPTIRTDHPQYAGEGAFQTIEQCVEFATKSARGKGEQEQALAMYNWLLTHQFHLHSPQEWNVPGLVPGATSHADMTVYDANRSRFSYGYGLCGTVHAWNEPYWRALGMAARRRAFPGHTNSEIKYGGTWHAFDTDMAGLVFRSDGVVAGYADIAKDPALVKQTQPGVPCYPFAWPGDFKGMQDGWKEIAKGGNWYSMYNGGYAAQPAIVNLRSGETFTRWFDRDHYGGPSKRRFWHKQQGGPFRDWTFVNKGEPIHNGAESNSRGNASYCNGEFVYVPNLAAPINDTSLTATENIAHREQSPRLHSADGKPASVTFQHFSPYVICGDPADDTDPMSGPATGGLVVAGKAVGQVALELSANSGQTWTKIGDLTGGFSHDLTDHVKGRYGWQLRFTCQGTAGLDELSFTTVTQVSQMIYPRLTSGGSTVIYQSTSRAVVPVLPALDTPGDAPTYEVTDMRSENVKYTPRTKDSRYAYQTTNNKPGSIVFRIDAPRNLVGLHAAVRYGIRVPPPAEAEYRLDMSIDDGKTWHENTRAEIPTDNEYSSGWLSGFSEINAEITSVLVRVHFYAGGYTTGIIEAEFYGVYETDPAEELDLTYGWKQGAESHTHVEPIVAGKKFHKFVVPTGEAVVDEFVRMSAK